MRPAQIAVAGRTAPSPTLPQGYQRFHVERIIRTVSQELGLSTGGLRTLLAMIQATRPADWTQPEATPVCYLEQTALAIELNVTTRCIRQHEASFEKAGLLCKDVGADGKRGVFAGGRVTQGLSFAPMIERFPELVARAEHIDACAKESQYLRRKCSAARRALKLGLASMEDGSDPCLPSLRAVLASLPARYGHLDLPALQRLYEHLDQAAQRATELANLQSKTSSMSARDFLPHIQERTEEVTCSCTVEKNAPENQDVKRPNRVNQAETKGLHLHHLTPRRLYDMASEDLRMFLDARTAAVRPPTQYDFEQAVLALIPHIGIGPEAWDEAEAALGGFGAALAVLVIDANRSRPVAPIHNPGGSLRSFARLARKGELNLLGSLIALEKRLGRRRRRQSSGA